MQSECTRIPLLNRDGSVAGYTSVDYEDVGRLGDVTWRLWKGPGGRHYAARRVRSEGKRVVIWMHREILGLPRVRDGREVDHMNNDGLDNRRSNLRCVTHAQNMQNKASNQIATSRFRGVYWSKHTNRWIAQVRLNGQRTHLGSFVSELKAAAVVAEWRSRHMTHSVKTLSRVV